MRRYLIDTTALIDFSKGREPATSRIRSLLLSEDQVGICGINVAEFHAGIPSEARAIWDEFLAALVYWDITFSIAAHAGAYSCEFAHQGRPVSISDTIIAAVAHDHAATLVTGNVKDFPMSDISIEPLTRTN